MKDRVREKDAGKERDGLERVPYAVRLRVLACPRMTFAKNKVLGIPKTEEEEEGP